MKKRVINSKDKPLYFPHHDLARKQSKINLSFLSQNPSKLLTSSYDWANPSLPQKKGITC